MSTFLLTLAIAIIVVILAVAALALSWLITGKSTIVRGACGMDPNRIKDARCGTKKLHCGLCDTETQNKETKEIKK